MKFDRNKEHPFVQRAPTIELGLHGALTWTAINSEQIKFAIREGPFDRASVVIDHNQCKELLKALAAIVGVGVQHVTKRGVLVP